VQEWEWHLHPGWTTGCCQVVAYIIICKNKGGKGCKRTRAKEKGLNYSAMSAHEAFRIWNGYTIEMKRTSLWSDSFSERPSSSIVARSTHHFLYCLTHLIISYLVNVQAIGGGAAIDTSQFGTAAWKVRSSPEFFKFQFQSSVSLSHSGKRLMVMWLHFCEQRSAWISACCYCWWYFSGAARLCKAIRALPVGASVMDSRSASI